MGSKTLEQKAKKRGIPMVKFFDSIAYHEGVPVIYTQRHKLIKLTSKEAHYTVDGIAEVK